MPKPSEMTFEDLLVREDRHPDYGHAIASRLENWVENNLEFPDPGQRKLYLLLIVKSSDFPEIHSAYRVQIEADEFSVSVSIRNFPESLPSNVEVQNVKLIATSEL